METSHVRVLAVRHLDLWQSWRRIMLQGITSGRSWLSGYTGPRTIRLYKRSVNTLYIAISMIRVARIILPR